MCRNALISVENRKNYLGMGALPLDYSRGTPLLISSHALIITLIFCRRSINIFLKNFTSPLEQKVRTTDAV